MKRIRTPASWEPWVRQWKLSGLSMMGFCRQQSLPYSQFCYWRRRLDRKLRSKPSSTPAQFIPIVDEKTPELASKKPDLPLTISIGSYQIQVSRGFDEALLTDCLRILKGLAC